MNAAVDSTLKVIGKSSAMVSAGPRPGRTPIAVPSVVPTKHHRRFIGVSATAKPLRSCEKASISAALYADQPFDRGLDQAGTDIDAERRGEAEIGDERESRADQGVADDRLGAEAAGHADEQNGRSDSESRRTDQDDVEHQTGKDPEQGRSIGRGALLLLGLPASLPGVDEKEDAQQSESGRRHQRNDA